MPQADKMTSVLSELELRCIWRGNSGISLDSSKCFRCTRVKWINLFTPWMGLYGPLDKLQCNKKKNSTHNYISKELSLLNFLRKWPQSQNQWQILAEAIQRRTARLSRIHFMRLSCSPFHPPLSFFSQTAPCAILHHRLSLLLLCVCQKKSLQESSRIHVSNAAFNLSQNKIQQVQNQYSLTYRCSFIWCIKRVHYL